ncbi:MAG: hypothetical protein AAF215_21520 [Cyanobacteria bacterium P01_A01_bin.123]
MAATLLQQINMPPTIVKSLTLNAWEAGGEDEPLAAVAAVAAAHGEGDEPGEANESSGFDLDAY